MHDSCAAIPLEVATNLKAKSLYRLMDAAYNSGPIKTYITDAGKVAIIDPRKPKGGEKIALSPAEKERYKIRTTVERTYSTIKDDFGGSYVRVRGHQKVTSHLMLGVLAMTAPRIVNNSLSRPKSRPFLTAPITRWADAVRQNRRNLLQIHRILEIKNLSRKKIAVPNPNGICFKQ